MAAKRETTAERKSDVELVIRRTFDAPVQRVFEAWTKAELFKLWWVPRSFGMKLLSVDMDVRVGGKYRVVFAQGDGSMAFFGTYLEVTPPSRIVWTNEEGGANGSITTVTLTEADGRTLLVMSELFPSRKRSTPTVAARRMRCTRHSGNWMNCSSSSRRSRDR